MKCYHRHIVWVWAFFVLLYMAAQQVALAQAGWTSRAPLKTARDVHAVATGTDGRVYAIGGVTSDIWGTNSVEVYDPAVNSWTAVAPLQTGRFGLAAVTGPDGRIYAIGGQDNNGNVLNTVEAYDPVTNTWTFVAPMPTARVYLAAAVGRDGRIYAIGGSPGYNLQGLATVEAYDPKTNTWTTAPSLRELNGNVAATTGPEGRIYVIGAGYGSPFEIYDPSLGFWIPGPDLPRQRTGPSLVSGEDGKIYALGGLTISLGGLKFVDAVDAYDPVTGVWSPVEALPTPRADMAVASSADGRIVTIGGRNGGDLPRNALNTVEVYHLASAALAPTQGGNAGQVTVTIIYKGLQEGAAVKLVTDGQPDIVGQNTDILGDTGYQNTIRLKTTFDLSGTVPGPRFVIINNPDGTVLTLPQRFLVEEARASKLETHVIGRSKIRGGVETTYSVLVQNTGNIDATAVDLRIEFPKYFAWKLLSDELTSMFTGENNIAIGVPLSIIPAGSSVIIPLRVQAPDDPQYVDANFQFFGWTNQDPSIRVMYIGNLTEELVFRAETADHTVVEGRTLNSSGTINLIRVISPDGSLLDITLNDHGLITAIRDSEDTGFDFTYPKVSSTSAKVQSTSVLVTGVCKGTAVLSVLTVLPTPLSTILLPVALGLSPCDLARIFYFIDDSLQTLGNIDSNSSAYNAVLQYFKDHAEYTLLPALLTALNNTANAFNLDLAVLAVIRKVHTYRDAGDLLTNLFNCFQIGFSGDPNDLAGALGFDTAHWIASTQPLPYTVYFSNIPTASAPAQVVTVTDPLNSSNLDLSTLSLGPITFGDYTVTPEANINPIEGVREYNADVDMRPAKNLIVHVNAKLNLDNGLLTWTFTSIDPATGQPLDPVDPNGFLDPGQEGSVFFTVMPKKGLKTGTVTSNTATIVFDVNAPMNTSTWLNTFDNDAPISQVAALTTTQNALNFTVQWSGTDTINGVAGSDIRDFTIYVSDNGGPFTPWLVNTTATSAQFNGVFGHTYAFYSQARDNVGNVEAAHTQADTLTTVTATFNFSGAVTLQNAVNQAQTLTLEFRPTDGSASFTQPVTLNSDGTFRLTDVPAGAYNLAIKGSKWLQKVVPVDGTNGDVSGVAATLLAGDVNGDNQVSLADYVLLRNAFGSRSTSANWNANADLDCDGQVSLADYVLLRNNFGKKGDP